MVVLLINISVDNSVDIIMGMHWVHGRVSLSVIQMDVQCGTSFDEQHLKHAYQCEHASYFRYKFN
jgi:hypothetical protein